MADSSPFADSSPLEVADAIAQLGSAMGAFHREMLAMIALADEREDWREDGAYDMASWLCARLGLRAANAAEWVRVAHALEHLPECARAYAEGRLAWDQVRPLTEFATPEGDAEQASDACGSPASLLEAQARRARRVSRPEAERQEQRKYVRMWSNEREGFRLSARLPVADGAAVAEALHRIAEQGDPSEPLSDRLAEALTGLSSTRLAEDQDADRACVVLHVDAAALAGEGSGSAQLEGDGATDLDNVICMCGACHKLVHEMGWTVSGNANGKLTFTSPTGRVLTTGPPGLRREVREDLGRAIGWAS